MTRPWGQGDVIMGRYRLVSLLGMGGMGSVWRAEHLQLQSEVAVKLLDPSIADDEHVLGRFLLEARAAATLRNRHVVQIFDYGVEEGNAFIVMELLHGETLGARIERLGVLPVEEAVRFMCQVMRAIAPAHDNDIIHRDLKPDNIFITSDEEGEYAKVLDFGVAKVKSGSLGDAGVKTQTGMMVGTPYYMSPEQAKAKSVDHRSDIWAIAVITYEAITGQRPFGGESFGDLVLNICTQPVPLPSTIAQVPRGFDEWFVHGTQRDVEKRFRSTREMAQELMQLAAAPLVGRKSALQAAQAPDADEAATLVEPRQASNTPAHGTPLGAAGKPKAGGRPADAMRRLRLALTTGQRAATGYDTQHGRSHGRPSWGVLVALGSAAAIILAAGSLYVWRLYGSPHEALTDEAPPTLGAAAPALEPKEPAELASDPPAPNPSANDGRDPDDTEPEPTKDAAEPAEAPSAKPSASTQPSPKPSRPSVRSPEPSRAPALKETSKAPPQETERNRVPVVDKNALPPKTWDF